MLSLLLAVEMLGTASPSAVVGEPGKLAGIPHDISPALRPPCLSETVASTVLPAVLDSLQLTKHRYHWSDSQPYQHYCGQ